MIKVENMHFSYNGRPLFDDFSFHLPMGQVCLVTGINGVGKSTLLRLLAGVLRPQKGSIIYHASLGREPRQKIGFISDKLSIYQSMRVDRLIEFHLSAFGVKEFDDRLIRHTRIEGRNKVRDLSIGQRTILHLSLILSTRPELLLIDEVIHDLDAYLRKLFIDELINQMSERSLSVVFVNLNFHDIENLVERVVLLKNGNIAVDEPIDILKEKVKRVISSEALPQSIPHIYRISRENCEEYFIYPFSDEHASLISGKVQDLNLTEIVTAFIGGEYV